MKAMTRTRGETQTTTTHTTTRTTRRRLMQAAFTLLLAGSVAGGILPGAQASDNETDLGVSALFCQYAGGTWIEWVGDNGWVMSSTCLFPDGSGYNCDANGAWCKPFSAGAPTPVKGVPDIGGQVSGDLGPSADPMTGPAAPGVAAPDDHQHHDQDSGTSKKSKKGKKGGKGRKK